MAVAVATSGVLHLIRSHQRALERAPAATNAMTSGVIMLTGDTIAQRLERGDGGSGAHDWGRSAILTSWSACLSAPWWTFWYALLARRMPSQQLVWVASTAVVGIPFNAAFFTYTSVVHELARTREPPLTSAAGRQRVVDAARDKLEAKLWPTVLASFQVWPFANCVMYYGVSLPYSRGELASLRVPPS